ncbi:MAG: hypothetical protein QM755_10645 [Luteolibacter sp.]
MNSGLTRWPVSGTFRGMPEAQLENLFIVAVFGTGLLLLCVFLLARISWRLGRIEKSLVVQLETGRKPEKSESPEAADMSGLFGRFLSEHPEWVQEPKAEQFAAYRKWRKEQGLNWEGR